MQQSKTPNNIKSVIRQVNFVRAPKAQAQAQGGKIVQKVVMQRAQKAQVPSQGRQHKKSVDFSTCIDQKHPYSVQLSEIDQQYKSIPAAAKYSPFDGSSNEPHLAIDVCHSNRGWNIADCKSCHSDHYKMFNEGVLVL